MKEKRVKGNSWWNQIATPPTATANAGADEQDYWSAQDLDAGGGAGSGGVVDTLPMGPVLEGYVNDIGGGPADGFYAEQQHKGARPQTQGDEFYASVGAENGVYSPGRSNGVGGRANTNNSMSNYDNAAGVGVTAAEGAVHDAHYEAYGNEDEDGGAGGYGNAAEIRPHTATAEDGRYYERVGAPENEYSNMEMEMELGNSYATPYAQQQQQESQQFDHYAQPQQYLQQQQGPPSQRAHADRSSYAIFNSGGSPRPATAQQLPEAWTPAAWNASAHLSMLPWVTVQRFPKKKKVELPALIQKTTETSMQTDPPPTTSELEVQTDPKHPGETVECQTVPMGTDFSAQTEAMGVDFWVQTDPPAVLIDGSMQTHTEIQTQTYVAPVDMATQTGVEDTDPDISVNFSALDEFGRRQHVKFESSVDTLNASMAQVAMGGKPGGPNLLSSTAVGSNTSFGPNTSYDRSAYASRFDDGRNGLNDTNGMDMANLSHMTSQLIPSMFLPPAPPPPPKPVNHTTQTDPPPNNVISIQTDPPPMVTSMAVQTEPMVLSDDPLATGSPRKPFRKMSMMMSNMNGSGMGGGNNSMAMDGHASFDGGGGAYGNGDVGSDYTARSSSPVRRSSIRHGSRTSLSAPSTSAGSLRSPRSAWGAGDGGLTDGGGPPSPRRHRPAATLSSSSAAYRSGESTLNSSATSPSPPVFSTPNRRSSHSTTSTPRSASSHRPPRQPGDGGGGSSNSSSLFTTREYNTSGISETIGKRTYRRGARGVANESVLRGLDEGALDHSTNSSFGLFTAKSPGSSIRRY